MVSNDAQRMEKFILYFVFAVFSLVDSVLSILLLLILVGWQSISGAFVVLVFSFTQLWSGRLFAKYRIKQASATDKRLTAMNEIITGIRAVKMYAWEWNYRDIIKRLRRYSSYLCIVYTWYCIQSSPSLFPASWKVPMQPNNMQSRYDIFYPFTLLLTSRMICNSSALILGMKHSQARQVVGWKTKSGLTGGTSVAQTWTAFSFDDWHSIPTLGPKW